jgi:hypothetical protein
LHRHLRSFILPLVSLLALTPGAQSATIVPDNYANNAGNVSVLGVITLLPGVSQRLQQVIGASGLALPGPVLINAVAYRGATTNVLSPYTATIENLLVNMSTTSRNVDALSTTFTENTGPDETTVFSGSITLGSAGFVNPAPVPRPFELIINFSKPFYYDPSKGNLLLDIRNFSGTTPDSPSRIPSLDGTTSAQDSMSVMGSIQGGPDQNASTGVNATTGFTSTNATIVQFTYDVVVPEPSTYALAGTALATLLLLRRRSASR